MAITGNTFCTDHWYSIDHRFIKSCRGIYIHIVLTMNRSRASETVLTITVAFLVLYIIKGKENHWMLYTALIIGALGLFWKWLRIRIHDLWFMLADLLGYVISRLVLGVAFFMIVMPFGFLARLFRKDLMYLKKGRKSYFRKRRHIFTGNDLVNPW